MTTKYQVEEASALLLTVVNQAMARGLFNNIEDIPKVLGAVQLPQILYDELTKCRAASDDQYALLQQSAAEVLALKNKYTDSTKQE